jgi:hypothetical protein
MNPRQAAERQCLGCGGSFQTSNGKQKFCRSACYPRKAEARMRAERARIEREATPRRPGALARRWESKVVDASPIFASWEDYICRTTERERRFRCQTIANKANKPRLLSGAVTTKTTAETVWQVIENARGRCIHCRSLCVENRPTVAGKGAPAPWAHVGRRVGSLEHLKARIQGGDNDRVNLAWSCLWCNTWPQERRAYATDHGGYYPP